MRTAVAGRNVARRCRSLWCTLASELSSCRKALGQISPFMHARKAGHLEFVFDCCDSPRGKRRVSPARRRARPTHQCFGRLLKTPFVAFLLAARGEDHSLLRSWHRLKLFFQRTPPLRESSRICTRLSAPSRGIPMAREGWVPVFRRGIYFSPISPRKYHLRPGSSSAARPSLVKARATRLRDCGVRRRVAKK